MLTLEKLIKDRYDFYESMLPEIKKWGSHDGVASIAQEIKNGLYHDAISQCIQYIEDLFALINATKQPDYFVKNIVTYNAGRITNQINSYKATKSNVIRDFYVPDVIFSDDKDQQEIIDGVDQLIEIVDDQVKFYKKYWFFYNQYKHGLAIPMKPFGNPFNKDQIELDKKDEMPPYIVAYYNMNIKVSSSKGLFNSRDGICMPGFTDNVRPFIGDLEKENNFLRFVFPPDIPNFNIELLVDQAYKTRACINILIGNYMNEIAPEGELRKFQLPIDYKKNTALNCSYKIDND